MCLKESVWKKEILLLLVLDSTDIETDRYDYEERPVKKTKKYYYLMNFSLSIFFRRKNRYN